MALTSITAQTGATVSGRLLARTGAVTLDSNTIPRPSSLVRRGPDRDVDGDADVHPDGDADLPPDRDADCPDGPSHGVCPADGGRHRPSVFSARDVDTSEARRPDAAPRVPTGHPLTGHSPTDTMSSSPVGTGHGIGLGLGLGMIALGGFAGVAGRSRRPRRLH